MTREVVVTGMGMTTPLGGDVASTWSALLAGTSGISTITDEWVLEQPCHIAGFMAVDPTDVLDRVNHDAWIAPNKPPSLLLVKHGPTPAHQTWTSTGSAQ